ncbi:MAG: LysM peptidoglycan-binding domain-containing protein [Anaerolineae bacterium]
MEGLNYPYYDEEERQESRLGLVGIVFGLAIGGFLLYKLAGPPHLPSPLPSWQLILVTLNGSEVPLEALAYIFTTAAWLVWGWIVVSLAFHLFLAMADIATRGAAWVRNLHEVLDPLTAPLVRRVVDGAVVAAFVVNVAGRMTPGASAASQATTPIVLVAGAHADEQPAHPEEPQATEQRKVAYYTVQPGDSLWAISERFYGTGEEFMRLVDANDGRPMVGGAEFTRVGVIHPGWVLVIPMPSEHVEEVNDETYYVVEKGDTLWGIAARFLGDPTRYTEIFELNRGVAHPKTGWRLTNPSLIWPGLRLKLPVEKQVTTAQPADAPAAHEAPVEAPPRVLPPSDPPLTVAAPAPLPTATAPLPTAVPPPSATPTQAPTVMAAPPADASARELPPLLWGIAGVSAAAVAGAATLAVRRFRRSMSEPPVPLDDGPPIKPGFTDADLARVLTHRIEGNEVEPAILVAEQWLRFLREYDLDTAPIVAARQSPNTVSLTLNVPVEAEARIVALAAQFGQRLGCSAETRRTPDQDLQLRVTEPKLTTLLTPDTGRSDALLLAPVGIFRHEMLYVNWRALKHVLVAGVAGSGPDIVLTSLVSALAARCRPEELRLWTIASPRTLPPELAHLPHRCGELIDPADEARVADVLAEVAAELARRMGQVNDDPKQREAGSSGEPEIVLVLGELADVDIDAALLDKLEMHGPQHRIRILAATSQPEVLEDDMVHRFTTRLVLEMMDEEESIRLLAEPDAADLATGEILVRIDGRRMTLVRGLRVSGDNLEHIIRLMNEAYGSQAPPAPPSSNGVPRSDEGSTNGDGIEQLALNTSQANGEGSRPLAVEVEAPSAVTERVAPAARSEVPAAPITANGHVTKKRASTKKSTTVAQLEEIVPAANGDAAACRAADADDAMQPSTTVQVYCFGGFSVWHGDRQLDAVSKEGGVYKAWEVLTFLACHPQSGVSREKIIASIWPDEEPKFLKSRLSSMINKLRDALVYQVEDLPRDAVRNERRGLCSLDPTLITSDVHQFQALCRDSQHLPPAKAIAALEQAIALYKGDLLAGSDNRRYSWLDDRSETGVTLREHYRDQYSRVRRRLARLYRDAGQIERAIGEYNELLRMEPLLEDVVQELYRCYQQTGDLTALVKEDRKLRRALRDAFGRANDAADDREGYPPQPETVALFEAIRQELEAKAASRSTNGRRSRRARG